MMDKLLEIKVCELRDEVQKLQQEFVGAPLTRARVEGLNERFMELFDRFNLSDLRWRLLVDQDDGSITFDPIREIDKLAWCSIIK